MIDKIIYKILGYMTSFDTENRYIVIKKNKN